MLKRKITLREDEEIPAYELCDKIGVHRNFFRETIKSARISVYATKIFR